MSGTYPPLDITPYWARLNEELIEIVDLTPEEKMDWSPSPEQWNVRGIVLHIIGSRHRHMEKAVRDKKQTPYLVRAGQSKQGLKEHLALSWQRLEGLLTDPAMLSHQYPSADADGAWRSLARRPKAPGNGHWIAFHRLQHDVEHRAQLLGSLDALGVEPPY